MTIFDTPHPLAGFRIDTEITPERGRELIELSTDPSDIELQQYTNVGRFADEAALQRWLQKNRDTYLLVEDSTNALAGIIWFGPKAPPQDARFREGFDSTDYRHTFSIRIFKAHRGRRLAKPFMEEAFARHRQTLSAGEHKAFWLLVTEDNLPAIKAYERFGFRQATDAFDGGKIIMVLTT